RTCGAWPLTVRRAFPACCRCCVANWTSPWRCPGKPACGSSPVRSFLREAQGMLSLGLFHLRSDEKRHTESIPWASFAPFANRSGHSHNSAHLHSPPSCSAFGNRSHGKHQCIGFGGIVGRQRCPAFGSHLGAPILLATGTTPQAPSARLLRSRHAPRRHR